METGGESGNQIRINGVKISRIRRIRRNAKGNRRTTRRKRRKRKREREGGNGGRDRERERVRDRVRRGGRVEERGLLGGREMQTIHSRPRSEEKRREESMN